MNRISENFRVLQARKTALATKTRGFRGSKLAEPSTPPNEGPRSASGHAQGALAIRPVFILALFLLGLGASYQVGRSNWQGISRTPPDDLGKTFEPFWETWNLVQKNYVDPSAAKNQLMAQGAIKGMLESLGDTGHTYYLTPEEYEQYVASMKGEGKGIGVRLTLHNQLPKVMETFAGSPARTAGLRPGDVIQQIDGTTVTGLPIVKIVGMLRSGAEGSIVHLRILRSGETRARDFYIARGHEKAPPVVWQTLAGTSVMHVGIRQFDARTPGLVKTAVQEAREDGLQGLILDLRGCSGGLVDEALATTNEFLSEGTIVLELDAQGNRLVHPVKPGGKATDIPVCVLINEKTASSAELMAGALKDNGRAILVGTRTAGMGTMLHPFKLHDGSVVFLAIAQWLTPNGHQIWHKGIAPDFEAKSPEGVDLLLPGSETESNLLSNCKDRQLLRGLEVVQNQIQARSGSHLVASAR
jgi:carboxyl-terminal processing protease